MDVPEPNRPSLSGYINAGKLLSWRWVDSRMVPARNYWVTTRSTGYPSSRPVWGLWRDARLYFSTGSAMIRNIEGHAAQMDVSVKTVYSKKHKIRCRLERALEAASAA